jgi:hypothetical protein
LQRVLGVMSKDSSLRLDECRNEGSTKLHVHAVWNCPGLR